MAQLNACDVVQDDLINELLGKKTQYTSYIPHVEDFSFLDIDPPLGHINFRFDDSNQEIEQSHLSYQHHDPSQLIYASNTTSFSQDTYQRKQVQNVIFNQKGVQERPKREKNSNAIKKIGRIILDNLRQYRKIDQNNTPISNMLKMLSKNSKVGRTEINKRDKFNTYHLRMLFNSKDETIIHYNLKTTRAILSRHLRSNVMTSKQISDSNKALYLNTMKCSVLRCLNRALAVRLQMATER